ncbi:hypothetical protein AB0N33_20880, partial [Pseudarthrobacter oxydans]
MAMTRARHTDAGSEIKIRLSISRMNPAAKGMINNQRGRLLQKRAKRSHASNDAHHIILLSTI